MASVFGEMASGTWLFSQFESRPVPRRCSDARALFPDTVIIVACEPRIYQQLSRQWHDRGTARNLDDAMHQLELERAARPPVIEVAQLTAAPPVIREVAVP